LQVDKQLGSFEVSRRNSDVVLLTRVIELGESPIDKSQLAVSMVDHDVVGFHITMHDTTGVAVVKRLQDLEHVETDVEVGEALVEGAEIVITSLDVLHDQSRRFGQRIPDHIDQVNDVDATANGLQDLNLTSDLRLLDRLQNFNDNRLVVLCVDPGVHLRVLTTTDLLDYLVVLLRAKLDLEVLVIRILLRHLLAYICIILGRHHIRSKTTIK